MRYAWPIGRRMPLEYIFFLFICRSDPTHLDCRPSQTQAHPPLSRCSEKGVETRKKSKSFVDIRIPFRIFQICYNRLSLILF